MRLVSKCKPGMRDGGLRALNIQLSEFVKCERRRHRMFTRQSPSTGTTSPDVTGFYDRDTGSVMYVAADPNTKQAALIDVVMDFDPAHGRTRTDSAQEGLDFVRDNGL